MIEIKAGHDQNKKVIEEVSGFSKIKWLDEIGCAHCPGKKIAARIHNGQVIQWDLPGIQLQHVMRLPMSDNLPHGSSTLIDPFANSYR